MESRTTISGRPPRILTIDNGGLQAISILTVLKQVCIVLSKGHDQVLAPYELFDIIGGIGTGGWLAILLGRYRLRIDECFNVYASIADAINPTRTSSTTSQTKGLPAVINEETLIRTIDRAVEQHGIGKYMVEGGNQNHKSTDDPACYAFAVGVVQREQSHHERQYHLFRAYETSAESAIDPTKCKVSDVCAATAAAADFMRPYRLGKTTYWDDKFPLTHNVSKLALEEAAALFNVQRNGIAPQFVLSISPGIATSDELGTLKTCALKNASLYYKGRHYLRRAMSFDALSFLTTPTTTTTDSTNPPTRSISDPTHGIHRTDTNLSKLTEAAHEDTIRTQLRHDFDDEFLYHRLELPESSKPYLDDVARPSEAIKAAEDYLLLPAAASVLASLERRSVPRLVPPQTTFDGYEQPRSASPEPYSSFTTVEARTYPARDLWKTSAPSVGVEGH